MLKETIGKPNVESAIFENDTISSRIWEILDQLLQGNGWPSSEEDIDEFYDQLIQQNQDWPDRYVSNLILLISLF